MAYYNENVGNRILELLSYPMLDRCAELAMLFDRCSLRELQDIFPTVVKSVFGIGTGGLGWGLRATTKENAPPHCFDMLHDFFSPLGPMFRLCYRLLNDAIKFEFNLELLPHKVAELMQSGQYSMFYADLINIDPFRRQVSSLSLNAFDYYVLHFVIHATFPLHKMYPAALQVHNERMKTVYFFLTAEYLCTFLPSSPDGVVLPTNICATVKAPQPMPVQPMQPMRSPKYLKIPNSSSLYSGGSSNSSATAASAQAAARNNAESPRAHAWRTESVLHFFIDTWLRYDIDEARDLPSSEFIRVVRILVKQTHTFANSASIDQTAMVTLRKIAQPMMKARIYPFLKSIIGRWPLDSSLSVVLELWLSYIQPWRYTCTWQNNSATNLEIPINNRFENFIADNLVIYTQIFVHILPRFERLDFTSFRNVIMLHRLVKVFSQSTLPKRLYQAEQSYAGSNSFGFDSPQKHSTYIRHNTSSGACEWDTFFHEEMYTPMFGAALQTEIEQFIKTVYISRMYVQQEINTIRRDLLERRKSFGFFKKIFSSLFEDVSPAEIKLQEIIKIPDILDLAIRSLGTMFGVELPNISMEQIEPREQSYAQVNFSLYDCSDYLDLSKISPMQMRSNMANIKATIDPALFPIQTHECKILVRFLHQVSCKINEMYGDELQACWNRSDFFGKLTRQILNPPMTAQWFDKPKGISELCEDQLPARLCLRSLASYKVLALLALSLIIGHLMWGAPSYGLISVFLLFVIYLFVLAVFT